MEQNNYISAIDIGTTKIVAIIGRKTEKNNLEILGFGQSPSRGIRRGVVLNIEETVSSIRTAVNKAQNQADIKIKDVYVGIAGQHIRSTKNSGRKYIDKKNETITHQDVFELIEDMKRIPVEPGEEILHVIPQSYIVDDEYNVKYPVGTAGRCLVANFHIVIGKTFSANNIRRCINRVGLNVKNLILEPLAASQAVLTDEEKEVGVALIDIGGGTTDLAIYYDNIIRHTAVIPFGGYVITKDIKEGCGILEKLAEQIKIEFGSALGQEVEEAYITLPGLKGREAKQISSRTLAYIIQSRMEEITGFINFEIENSGCADKLGAGIVITGGGSLLRHLPQFLAYHLGYEVRLGIPNEYIQGKYKEQMTNPMFSTAVGLILKAYEEIEQAQMFNKNTDKQEPKSRKQKSEKESKTIFRPFKNVINDLKNKVESFFEEKDNNM